MRGWEWWLTSIIPTLWEAEAGVSLEPSLHNMLRPNLYQKVKEKLIQVWWCNPVVSASRRLRWEEDGSLKPESGGAVSQDYATVLQPGQQSETLSQNKKKM